MNSHFIAWWNVENLFDVQSSAQRPDWLQKVVSKELSGWNEKVLSKKIKQLASIIMQMNDNAGPDILGLCEVENLHVLELLINGLSSLNRDYGIAHHDMKDKRGIDVAFIYDKSRYSTKKSEWFFYEVLKRQATRDIFQVNFTDKNSKKDLIVIGNHWPSRSGGELQSEPYRIIAAETLSYWLQRISDIKGEDAAVVVMGDFNDEPFNRSITQYALASNNRTEVVKAKTPRTYNLMWQFYGKEIGTHFFDGFSILDQFFVSKGILNKKSGFQIGKLPGGEPGVRIEMFPEMIAKGAYPKPMRFGRPAEKASFNENGFSDHFPISLMLESKF